MPEAVWTTCAHVRAVLDKVDVAALYAQCCMDGVLATGVTAAAFGTGVGQGLMAGCNARLVRSATKNKQAPRIYGFSDSSQLCAQHVTSAVEAANAATGLDTPASVKAAAAELRAANERLVAQLRACAAAAVPSAPTLPPPPGGLPISDGVGRVRTRLLRRGLAVQNGH